MNRDERWNEFQRDLFEHAWKNGPTERERDYRRERDAAIDNLLSNDLTIDQKETVESVLLELGANAELDAMLVYQQGMRDGIWLLKNLGVLM